MLLNFPLVRIIRQYQGIHQPTVYALSCKRRHQMCGIPIIVMGNGRLLFQDLSKEIFVSLTLQKMMSNESVLCSVRPNRKIFQEKINDTISVLKIYLRLVFPFIRCFKTYSKMQCTIIIGVSK